MTPSLPGLTAFCAFRILLKNAGDALPAVLSRQNTLFPNGWPEACDMQGRRWHPVAQMGQAFLDVSGWQRPVQTDAMNWALDRFPDCPSGPHSLGLTWAALLFSDRHDVRTGLPFCDFTDAESALRRRVQDLIAALPDTERRQAERYASEALASRINEDLLNSQSLSALRSWHDPLQTWIHTPSTAGLDARAMADPAGSPLLDMAVSALMTVLAVMDTEHGQETMGARHLLSCAQWRLLAPAHENDERPLDRGCPTVLGPAHRKAWRNLAMGCFGLPFLKPPHQEWLRGSDPGRFLLGIKAIFALMEQDPPRTQTLQDLSVELTPVWPTVLQHLPLFQHWCQWLPFSERPELTHAVALMAEQAVDLQARWLDTLLPQAQTPPSRPRM